MTAPDQCCINVKKLLSIRRRPHMTHSRRWSWLKAWGMKIARHRGMKRAIVAVARRLAVIMHRMWMDGTEFRWTREEATAA
jgi:transposase